MFQVARDITAELCPLIPNNRPDNAITMYSYDRPAYLLWQAVFEGLITRGWSEKDAIAWLQSKGPRHVLDGFGSDLLEAVGRQIAAVADKSYIRD